MVYFNGKSSIKDKSFKSHKRNYILSSKGKERLKSMIETRPDWCVSRQRVWGVPLPIFINKKTNKILVDEEVIENIAKIFEKEGSDCWFSDDPQRFLGDKYKSKDFENLVILKYGFTVDLLILLYLKKERSKMASVDVLRGFRPTSRLVHSSLLESCGTRDRAPFETILSHGFVVDGKGLKMSKSLGNVIAPDDILKKYGADILRIWVASSNYAEDLRIDYSILDQHSESYRKLEILLDIYLEI